MSELVLSASSVETWMQCHYRWYLQYVELHAGGQNTKSAVGMGVHAATEHHDKTILATGLRPTMEEVLDVFDNTFLMETFAIEEPDKDLPDLTKARAIGRRCTVTYIEDIASKETPLLVEHAGRITVNGIPFSYHIDRVVAGPRGHVVKDLKVKGQKPRYPSDFAFAGTGYALGARADLGEIEADVVYDVVLRLKRDRPYVVPYPNGGPISSQAVGIFAATLERAAEGIDRGDYQPTGLEKGICGWCSVRNLCEPYQNWTDAQGTNTASGHEHWSED